MLPWVYKRTVRLILNVPIVFLEAYGMLDIIGIFLLTFSLSKHSNGRNTQLEKNKIFYEHESIIMSTGKIVQDEFICRRAPNKLSVSQYKRLGDLSRVQWKFFMNSLTHFMENY